MLLLAPLLLLLLIGYVSEVRTAIALSTSTTQLLRSPIARATALFVLLITVPWWAVHTLDWPGDLIGSDRFLLAASLVVSALISFTWYRYLTWLDPFEREPLRWEITVFLLSCSITWMVPRAYELVHAHTGFSLTGDLWNDWWYCVGVIGGIEETAKLLPWLFLWRATRQVNEPFDFILYASVSALGFAFVENVNYLFGSELTAVMGRALMASVAHMLFASIPAYAVAIALHRERRAVVLHLAGGFALAALFHGFYDLWLLDPSRPGWLTFIFFLGSLQLWVIMKNNLVNLSPRYVHAARPMSRMFRYRIINGMLLILAAAYLASNLFEGRDAADRLLRTNAGGMAIVLLVTAMHFSSFVPIPGYIAPLRMAGDVWRWFVPRWHWDHDLTGARVELRPRRSLSLIKRWTGFMAGLPAIGTIDRRVVVDDDHDWYVFRPDRAIIVNERPLDALLLKVHADHDTLPDDGLVIVHVAAPLRGEGSGAARTAWQRSQLVPLGTPLAHLMERPFDRRSEGASSGRT